MKPTRRRRVRKLIFPVIALVMMIAAMGNASHRQSQRPVLTQAR